MNKLAKLFLILIVVIQWIQLHYQYLLLSMHCQIIFTKLVLQFKNSNMNTKIKKNSCDLTSCSSTQIDSSEERDQQITILKTNPLKHKTELCKNFSELGFCNYGQKCRFAHGSHELVKTSSKSTFRKKKCNGFWKNGVCLYGTRCQFMHDEGNWDTQAILDGMKIVCEVPTLSKNSKLLKLLH